MLVACLRLWHLDALPVVLVGLADLDPRHLAPLIRYASRLEVDECDLLVAACHRWVRIDTDFWRQADFFILQAVEGVLLRLLEGLFEDLSEVDRWWLLQCLIPVRIVPLALLHLIGFALRGLLKKR